MIGLYVLFGKSDYSDEDVGVESSVLADGGDLSR